MTNKQLTCFKTYDIRGEIDIDFDRNIAYRIGRSVAQHFRASNVVVGYDARETSPSFASSVTKGICDSGSNVIFIGLAGTEEMYWAVTEFGACAGIEVTASHNPINFNGMKIVKSGSKPLDKKSDFLEIKNLAIKQDWLPSVKHGKVIDKKLYAREKYVDRILSFVQCSKVGPLKLAVNSGNGAAKPAFDAIAKRLSEQGAKLDFFYLNHEPDCRFPNGIPNPMLSKNQKVTSNFVIETGADLGIAFDGDFDRCFFFDENGKFISSEFIIGLLASIFLEREKFGVIVHDPRVIWNVQDIVAKKGGEVWQSKTGHSFIKSAMRDKNAIYGGELSAHHYFRDFAFCDSGMIPWLLIAQFLSQSSHSFSEVIKIRRKKFISSGEINLNVSNTNSIMDSVIATFGKDYMVERFDGVSVSASDWRFNLRKSNTESLVRLNVESSNLDKDLNGLVKKIISSILA